MTPAEKTLWFIQNLTLTEEYDGQPVRLSPFQVDFFTRLHAVNDLGESIVRRALLMLPRKQGKTEVAAFEVCDHILNTKKGGRVALCAASDRYQAGHLFNKVKTIIEAQPFLEKQCRIYKSAKRIETKTGNALQVMSSDGKRSHGENPSLVVADEVWTYPNRELFDALTSGFGARKEHKTLMISTSGNKREGLLWDEYQYACKVRDGLVIDPSFLPVIYEAGNESDVENPECRCEIKHKINDWRCEVTWRKAMPAWDQFVNQETMRLEFKKALEIPSEEAKCRQFYLNQWVAGEGKWLNREKWDACGKHPVDLEALKGRRAYLGADLSAKSDISGIQLLFPMDTEPQSYVCLPFAWIPKEYAKERDRKGYSDYKTHEKNGHITFTDGFYIDEDKIIEKIIQLGEIYKIKKVLFDEWSATRPATILASHGFKTGFMTQSNSKQNEPCKFLEMLIATEKLHHGNHPVLNIHAENCVINRDKHDFIRLDKQNSHDKIDLMSALVLAMAAAMVEKPRKVSVYEARGLISI